MNYSNLSRIGPPRKMKSTAFSNATERKKLMMTKNDKGPDAIHFSDDERRSFPVILDTEKLFGKEREINLSHRGVIYRLRITAQQKLILTK